MSEVNIWLAMSQQAVNEYQKIIQYDVDKAAYDAAVSEQAGLQARTDRLNAEIQEFIDMGETQLVFANVPTVTPPAEPTPYSGPMDDQTVKIMSAVAERGIADMFKQPTIGGKTYITLSINVNTNAAQDAIDHLTETWPAHFIVLGAWWMDGRQVGTQWEVDENPDSETFGERTGNTTGDPLYPIPAAAWRVMPDVVTYDENGDETSRVVATSNADLRDINLLAGQAPRRFS